MSAGSDQLRIGDAERERAQSLLGDHYAAGRLDHDEYSERLDRIWEARTRAELAPVFHDLPGGPVTRPRAAYSTPASRRPSARPVVRRVLRLHPLLVALLVVLAVVTVVSSLPFVLLALAAWFLLTRGGCAGQRRPHYSRW
jgi:hypothetical protein